MAARNTVLDKVSRREWAALLAVAPALSQVTSTVPPQAAGASAAKGKSRQAIRDEALDGVRKASQRLSEIEVPMDVEPAFSFRV